MGNILRSVWPLLRHLMPLKRRCKYCIISEAYAPLIGGLCPDCLTQNSKLASKTDPIAPKGAQERLDTLIQTHLSDAPYHALLMLSGGKDSAYILDRLRQEYPDLRLLCVTVNNGFMSPIAIKGAQHCAEKLHTDIIVSNACINRFKHALKNAFLSLNGQGSYGVIDYTDGSLIFEVGKDIAKQLNIPLLIGGLTWVQTQIIIGQDDFELKKQNDPTIIFPLAVWRPNEQEIRAHVREKELLPPGADDPLVSNSRLIMTMCALDVINLGYCSFEPEFAQLIREGKTDRKTWLYNFEMLEHAVRSGRMTKEIERTLSELGLTLDQVRGKQK